MPVDHVRDAAIDVLLRVFERGVFLDESLDKTLRRKEIADRGRRFLTQLCYGTVRHKMLCDHALQPLCHQPIEKLSPPILTILRMALFQSLFLRSVHKPAMVSTSVDLAKARGHAGIARMVNAILRKAPESIEELRLPSREKDLLRFLSVRYSVPRWLVEQWHEEFGPEQTESLCAVSAEEAPLTIRANTLAISAADLARKLTDAGYMTRPLPPLEEALIVEGGAGALLRSKAFQEGHFLFQDPASMLPALLLQPKPGERVLDMCAAPGGKTTHLAAISDGKAHIVAMDRSRKRLWRVSENLERLNLNQVDVLNADGAAPPFAPETFDAVLLDAPCSGLGTLRRHPDLKYKIQPGDFERLQCEQAALLRSATSLCKNGGRIIYSVCTLGRRETSDVVGAVLQSASVRLEDGSELFAKWQAGTGQYQTFPTSGAWDGFFLTRLRKQS